MSKVKVLVPVVLKWKLNNYFQFKGESQKHIEKYVEICESLWFFIWDLMTKSTEYRNCYKKFGVENCEVEINANNFIQFKYNNKQYSFFIQSLKDIGALMVWDVYIPGVKSKKYRINENIFGYDLQETEVKLVNPQGKSIYLSQNEWLEKIPCSSKIINYHYLTTIDTEKIKETRSLKCTEKYFNLINSSLMFNSRFFSFSRPDLEDPSQSGKGRLYSPMCYLNKMLRPYINLDGERVCEIDLSNCVPYVLSKYVESKQFKEDTSSGEFYYKLQEGMKTTKETAKKNFFTYVLYRNKTQGHYKEKGIANKYQDWMTENYLGVFERIQELNDDKTKLFNKLSKIEASVFIDGLQRETDRPFLSIHDAVLIQDKEENINYFMNLITRLFVEKGYLPPNLKVKKYENWWIEGQ